MLCIFCHRTYTFALFLNSTIATFYFVHSFQIMLCAEQIPSPCMCARVIPVASTPFRCDTSLNKSYLPRLSKSYQIYLLDLLCRGLGGTTPFRFRYPHYTCNPDCLHFHIPLIDSFLTPRSYVSFD
jgi:hypothetical protein